MTKFDEQLSRMKSLCTYGMVNEDENKQSNYTITYHKTAANGKEYGIIKECSRYYIKESTPNKAVLAESYNYIGGWNNKSRYEYGSYNDALKDLELKLSSINEACDSRIDVTTLDPFKKEDLVIEGTEKMRNEIARQRQIMYNAAMLMNESADYAVKGGKACTTSQPEAETGKKGDKMEGSKNANPDMEYKGSKTSGVKVDGGMPGAKTVKESCECGSCDTDFDEGLGKGKDPKSVGWNMEGEQTVNEEADEKFSEGLPSSAGVGEADSDHNNNPFNKNVNEAYELYGDNGEVASSLPDEINIDGLDEGECCEDEDAEMEDDDFDFDFEDDDVEGDVEGEDDFDGEDIDIDADELGDEAVEDNEFPEAEDGEDLGAIVDGGDEDLASQIEALKAQLAALEAKVNGGEVSDEPTEEPVADDLGDEDVEEIEFDEEGEEEPVDDLGDEENADELGDEEVEDDDFDGEDEEPLMEAKRRFMNGIVESVVKQFLNEDELHDFGKHPGYRKKPMQLPATGEDSNAHGKDINDDSVHSEAPFGEKIGNGDPFNQIVNAVTKDVKYQLAKGAPIEGKKKVN